MYCDIKDTKYGEQLAKQIGSRQAKEFAMATETPQFKSWFGNGKTVKLENGYVAPFVNPAMQVINEQGNKFNILERFRFKNMEDVENFLQSGIAGITLMSGTTYAIARDENRYVNQKLLEEINRIYPGLLVTNDSWTIASINKNFQYNDGKKYSKVLDRQSLIDEAVALSGSVKGIYKQFFNQSPEHALFEAAVQANSSEGERRGAIKSFGERIVEIALKLFPNAKVGDSFESYKQKTNGDVTKPSYHVTSILDKLSMRFGIPYRTIDNPNLDVKGYYDVDGTVVINLAKITGDTPFHEFAHPFMLVLEKENPALYEALSNELKSTKDGQQVMAEVNSRYSELGIAERTHEAIVQYVGKLAEQKYNQPASPFVRFMKWIRSIFKKINIDFANMSLDTKLSDIADMMTDEIYVADLKAAQSVANVIVRESRTDTNLTMESVFEKMKDRVLILSATIKRRSNGDKFKQDIAELKDMIEHADEATSIQNFVTNSVKYVDGAQKRFERLRESVKDPSKLSKDELFDNMHVLAELQQLLNVYQSLNDIKKLYLRDVENAADDETMIKLRDAIEKKDLIVEDFKSFALTYLTEWLYPYLEPTNKTLEAQGYKDKVLTKEDFRDQLKMALRDIGAAGFWLGASINSQDPISAAVGLALKDVIYTDHIKDLKTKEELTHSYNNIRGTAMFSTAKNEEEFNMQFLREIDNWEEIGVDEEGNSIYGYVKRLAFHTEYDDAAYKKAERKLYEDLGEKPSRDNFVAYKAYSSKVKAWFSQNTQINPKAAEIIAEKKKTLTKRQFERWLLANTKEMEEETYDSGMRASDFFKGKVYDHNVKRGTFRVFAGELVTPSEKWRNPQFDRMMKNEYYRKLYTAYKEANSKLDVYGLKYGIIPQVSKGKNLFSDLDWKKGVKENLKQIKTNAGKAVKAEFDEDRKVQRQDGTEVKKIPVKYTTMLKSEDLVVDLLQNVLKFSQMANNYTSMTEIEPNLNLLRTVINGDYNLGIKGREIAETSTKGIQKINSITKKIVPKAAREGLLNTRLNRFIDDVVYGDEEDLDAFNFLGRDISLNKLSGNIGFLTSLQNMALNFTGGINNVIIGNFNNSIEAVGGRFWSKKDWGWAHKEYFANLHTFLGEIAGQGEAHINYLAEHYSVPQGEFQDQFGNNISGGKVNKLLKTSSLFFLQKGGEHEIQVTGMLSLMKATKLKTKSGEEVNLYDAWVKAGKNFDKLKEDNEWSDMQDAAFRNTLHAITKNLHGVYNKFDKAMLQRKWYGKMALMFRKYMFTAFKSRYGGNYVDYELGTVQEGYWNNFAKKMYSEFKDYKWEAFRRMWSKDGYNEMEKAAMNKTLYEFGVMLASVVLAGVIGATGDGDDDADKSWLTHETALQITRFGADIRQFLSPADFIRVIKNPAASLNMFEKWIDWGAQWLHPFDEYQRKTGIADKGDNKLYIKTLKIMPVARQVINFMTPEEQIKFYNLTSASK